MNVRRFHFGSDYPEICEWWRARKWPFVEKAKLPANGFVAEKDGVKYAAVWVYVDGGLAFMEWLVTSHTAPLRGRKEAIQALLAFVKAEAGPFGVSSVVTFASNENLIAMYQECGFEIGDRNMTSLVLEVSK